MFTHKVKRTVRRKSPIKLKRDPEIVEPRPIFKPTPRPHAMRFGFGEIFFE